MTCLPSVGYTPKATNVGRRTEYILKKKNKPKNPPQTSNTGAARDSRKKQGSSYSLTVYKIRTRFILTFVPHPSFWAQRCRIK